MGAKTNAKSVRDTLDERLKSDASILENFSKLIGFAALAASGEPLSLFAGIAKVSEAAGAALAGGSEVARRLADNGKESGTSALHSYERFKALFYTACARVH